MLKRRSGSPSLTLFELFCGVPVLKWSCRLNRLARTDASGHPGYPNGDQLYTTETYLFQFPADVNGRLCVGAGTWRLLISPSSLAEASGSRTIDSLIVSIRPFVFNTENTADSVKTRGYDTKMTQIFSASFVLTLAT